MIFVIIKKEDNSIQGYYESSSIDSTSANRSWIQAEPICLHLELPQGLDPECVKYENNQLVEDTAKTVAKEARKWDSLRAQRNQKLQECDYIMFSDYPLADKSAWETYRTALRNLPENTVDPLSPTWPTKPS